MHCKQFTRIRGEDEAARSVAEDLVSSFIPQKATSLEKAVHSSSFCSFWAHVGSCQGAERKMCLNILIWLFQLYFSGESSTPKIVGIHSKNATELFKCHKYRFLGVPILDFIFGIISVGC